MSFTITMYKNNSESNRITKNLTSAVSVTGSIIDVDCLKVPVTLTALVRFFVMRFDSLLFLYIVIVKLIR